MDAGQQVNDNLFIDTKCSLQINDKQLLINNETTQYLKTHEFDHLLLEHYLIMNGRRTRRTSDELMVGFTTDIIWLMVGSITNDIICEI